MDKSIKEFEEERALLTDQTLAFSGQAIKRYFSLDSQVYREGELPCKTKELMGLVASLVLRCDDCILYHIMQCHKLGVTEKELDETMSIALVVGGSIVIPHLRRAVGRWNELSKK